VRWQRVGSACHPFCMPQRGKQAAHARGCHHAQPLRQDRALPGAALLRGGGGHLDGHVVIPQPVQLQRGASAALDAILCREHMSGGQLHADLSRVRAFVADSNGFLTCSSGLCKTWGAPRGACPSCCSSSG
jgi:hypothetical protein